MNEHRNASNQLTIDFDKIGAIKYHLITKSVVKQFGLEPKGKKISGPDEVFQEFTKGQLNINLEWDNWSGYIVCAQDSNSENLALEIAGYINAKYYS